MVPVTGEHGFDLRPGPWKPPANVPPALAVEAREQLARLREVQLAPAELTSIRGWLVALGNAVASSSALAPEDVEVKIAALLGLLDEYPAGVFTRATLKRAAQKFTFFPSFAELSKLLDEEESTLNVKRERLRQIIDAAKRPSGEPEEELPAGPRVLSAETEALLRRCYADLDAASEEMRRRRR
ncbi:hypothetical protein D3093_11675 [Azospirillum argentinense]|uniref:Uncharacterized protein n=1 Tax=Azospirillum argentinense TaxID=2970906 RepID=A0A4D8PEN3_9PROT|nr:hypothetical protein [Azospirillum argentinense]QCN95864.1 hypothetical protein D3093_11675 [Azospirillum argentinense]